MTIEEKIAVMQAYAEGKKIEYKLKTKDNWCINPNPDWNWGACEYRVKSESLWMNMVIKSLFMKSIEKRRNKL